MGVVRAAVDCTGIYADAVEAETEMMPAVRAAGVASGMGAAAVTGAAAGETAVIGVSVVT